MSDLDRLISLMNTLLMCKPESKAELADWYEKATGFYDLFVGSKDTLPEIPHLVWHYMADADIRMKDQEYARLQDEQMVDIIADLQLISAARLFKKSPRNH